MAVKSYADTPSSKTSLDGSEILVIQDGVDPAPLGLSQMKKTTLNAIKNWVSENLVGGLKFKGTCTWEVLQNKTGMVVGDMWNVSDRNGKNYAWNGTEWDDLGGDFSEVLQEAKDYTDEKVGDLDPSKLQGVVTFDEGELGVATDPYVTEGELAEQNAINVRQDYEIENLKALVNGLISEEKTLTTENGVATLESDFVAPNAFVESLEGKTVVWNQLNSLGLVSVPSVGWEEITSYFTGKANHVYIVTPVGTINGSNPTYKVWDEWNGLAGNQPFNAQYVFRVQTSSNRIILRSISAKGSSVRIYINDLTTLFGITSVSDVTDSMKTFVRTYAEAHPSYDAGSLVSAVYKRVGSYGADGSSLGSLSLSFLNSVTDIGIEGTVVDFEKGTVTWNYRVNSEGTSVEELATPVTRYFDELGITPIFPKIRIEGGGTISVVSEGATGEATIHYLKKYV